MQLRGRDTPGAASKPARSLEFFAIASTLSCPGGFVNRSSVSAAAGRRLMPPHRGYDFFRPAPDPGAPKILGRKQEGGVEEVVGDRNVGP